MKTIKISNQIIIIIVGFIILMLGYILRLRLELYGVDAATYEGYYNSIHILKDIKSIGVGDYLFFFFMYIAKDVGFVNYLFGLFLLVHALIFYGYKLVFEESSIILPFIAFLLYLSTATFYFHGLNVLRQGIAAAILLSGIACWINDKKKSGLIYLIIAALFHKYSLIFVILLSMYSAVFEKKNMRVTGPILFTSCVLVGIYYPVILYQLVNILGLESFGEKLYRYTQARAGVVSLDIKQALLTFNVVIFYFVYYRDINSRFASYYIIYLLFASLIMLFSGFDVIFNRYMLYSNLIVPLLVVMAVDVFKQKYIYIALVSLVGSVYALYVFNHPSVQLQFGVK